jgi:5-dehydro-2-deoxygluconokinase
MTRSPGFDKPLYIISFDHRGPILSMLGPTDMLPAEQIAEIEQMKSRFVLAKHLVYDGFQCAVAAGVPKHKVGILVDEGFGADILRHAQANEYTTACPVEKSGQEEFDFEYGEDFAKHVEDVGPTFCKAQVRYYSGVNQSSNRLQAARLKRLSDFLRGNSRSLFMLDLVVAADKVQLARAQGDKKVYELEIRPRLIVEAIEELQAAQIEPDVWRIEGFDRRDDCEKVVVAARRNGRDKVSCIIRGGAEDHNKVCEWLKTAATVPGFIGFAVGRAIFWEPLSRWAANKTPPKTAVAEISQLYREFVNVFEKRGRKQVA